MLFEVTESESQYIVQVEYFLCFRLQVVSLQEVPRRLIFPETRLPLNSILGTSVGRRTDKEARD